MDWHVRAFLRSSLVWLSVGVTIGVGMAIRPVWLAYRPVHLHALLLGFVTMMIYGVAYHVIPRFAGRPLPSRSAAVLHWWLSNAGLALMAAGFLARARGIAAHPFLLGSGGMASACGAYLFAYLIWRTLGAPRELRAAAARSAHDLRRAERDGLPLVTRR